VKRLIVGRRALRAKSAICDRCPKMSGDESNTTAQQPPGASPTPGGKESLHA
jgi:hypothetical protein